MPWFRPTGAGTGRLEETDDPEIRRKKRKWVGEQLATLEELKLVERRQRPGRRPEVFVLRDDGSGDPFDDPDGGPGNSYVSVLGAIIATGTLTEWSAHELAFYLCAMTAERYERDRRSRLGQALAAPLGGGVWYRPLRWFADIEGTMRLPNHVRFPFSVPTLERGLAAHRKNGLVQVEQWRRDPVTGKGFKTGRRNVYMNRFDSLEQFPEGIVDLEQALADLQLISSDEEETSR